LVPCFLSALTVGKEPADQYLRTFTWNKVKYRADKPLAELIDILQKVCGKLESIFKRTLLIYL
jgi:V-type H+-transporting ATPase subunit C